MTWAKLQQQQQHNGIVSRHHFKLPECTCQHNSGFS
jgi:hypothetical protein